MRVYTLSNPAYKAHALNYIVNCGLCGVTTHVHPSYKRHNFRKNKYLDLKSVFRFSVQILSEIFLILRITDLDFVINRSSHKVHVIFVTSQSNLICLDRFSKNAQTPNFVNIRPVAATFFNADRQRHMTNAIITFRIFLTCK
jgi:hypothetical protein